MKRYGSNPTIPDSDMLMTVYNGNQLGTMSCDGSSYDYDYDANGNMITDGYNAFELKYNFLNLTSAVSDMSDNVRATYSWLADGTKASVMGADGRGFVYLGSMVYFIGDGIRVLESAGFGDGRIVTSNGQDGLEYTNHYYLTDHLGSVRAVYNDELQVIARNDYYPFGNRHDKADMTAASNTFNRYLYNGKEEQVVGEVDFLDYGARMYDGQTGRWLTVDPLTETYYSVGPYNYTSNNPDQFIDPYEKHVESYQVEIQEQSVTSVTSNAQSTGIKIPSEITNGVRIETKSGLYNQAYLEMADMLDGKTPLSIKRAVFLAEWAYFDGKLDYDWFCSKIDSAAAFLNGFVKANGLEQYKTGQNMALTEYFFNPWSGNGYKPFIYDHNNIESKEDFSQQFVSKVMRTHKGQCRSLPYYYKILAEALGAEAYIAYAPIHTFIRYRDEDNLFPEDWVNVELTTHQFTPELHYVEVFEINEKALHNEVYLDPLTDRETIASQLADLAFAYSVKYGIYDDFTWLCTTKSLEYYPQKHNTHLIKAKTLESLLVKYLDRNGGKVDDYVLFLGNTLDKIQDRLMALGWEPLGKEYFDRLDQRNEEARRIIEETGGIKL